MGRPVFGGARPPRGRRRPELRAHVCHPHPQGEDRSPRCPCPGRGLSVGGLPPRAPALRCQRHVRARLTVRDALVRTRTRYISLIRALLRQHGWRVPSGSAEGFPQRVLALPLPGRLRSEVAPLLAVMRHLQPPLAYSDERIAAVTATDERVRRLQSVPNIGPVTAAAFVAAIDEASRFRHPHEVEAYLGLVPRERSSGETQRR